MFGKCVLVIFPWGLLLSALLVYAGGKYNLWVRKFWHHGPFRWGFGEGEWRICDKLALHGHTFPQLHWGACWGKNILRTFPGFPELLIHKEAPCYPR